MLIDDIKSSKIDAFKAKNTPAKTIYDIVINKYMLLNVERRSKQQEVTDTDVVAILQKTIKELTEEEENYVKAKNLEQAKVVALQRETLEKHLPKMLSEEEVKSIILGLEDKSIPFVMKHFKANYAGKVDMALVQKVLKTI